MGPTGSRVTHTETNIEKDLGVSTANDLKLAAQHEQAATKTMRVVQMTPRYFEDLDISGFRQVYKTYGRPTLNMQFRPGHHTTRKTSNA